MTSACGLKAFNFFGPLLIVYRRKLELEKNDKKDLGQIQKSYSFLYRSIRYIPNYMAFCTKHIRYCLGITIDSRHEPANTAAI